MRKRRTAIWKAAAPQDRPFCCLERGSANSMISRAWAAPASLRAAATAAPTPDVHAGDFLDADAVAITRKHCVMCHAQKPSHPSLDAPPKQAVLETIEAVKARSHKL